MQTVRKEVTIPTAPETVFRLLADSSVVSEIAPECVSFDEAGFRSGAGWHGTYTCRMLGLTGSGEIKTTDETPNERLIWSLKGDVRGTVRWYLNSIDDESRTRVGFAATYDTPGLSFLRRIASPLVSRYADRNVEQLLNNLRARIQ